MGQSMSNNSQAFEPRVERRDRSFDHDKPMLASVLSEFNPQSNSPIYTLLPGEVREMIFRLSIAASFESQSEPSTISSLRKSCPTIPRSQNTTTTNHTLALLLTCRRTYLETYHLPIQIKQHTFYRPSLISPPHLHNLSIKTYLQRFKPQQLQFLTKIHIITHQLFLEHGSFASICKLDLLQGIQKLKITIRYRDWWEWERSSRMELSPWGRVLETCKRDGTKMVHFELEECAWGYSFQYLKGLKELELQLETSDDRWEELERVVGEALDWVFPLKGGRVLRTRACEVRRSRRESEEGRWSDVCGRCFGKGDQCGDCDRRRMRIEAGLGPIIHAAILRWRVGEAGYSIN